MNEKQWVELLKGRIATSCISHSDSLDVRQGEKLAYGYEIFAYSGATPRKPKTAKFETDLVLTETAEDTWKPRIVIEAKLGSITTHDSITYSQKAAAHKAVHPYLRYGIVIGNWGRDPLPGRLYRHGMQFDFMMTFQAFEPTEVEMVRLTRVLHEEIEASRNLEKIIYESRKKDRDRYTLLHRRLHLE